MRIALAQTDPRLGDVEANLAGIEETVAAALAAGADLAVFPELALTGYRLRDLVPQVAVRLDRAGPVRDRLAALSERLPLVVGLVEESADHRFYNAAAWFEDGRLVHVHRKVYLPTYGMFDEAMDFARGRRLAAFDTRFGRAGILICEDLWHPTATTVLALDGAIMVFGIAASPLRGQGVGSAEPSHLSGRQLAEVLARFHTVPMVYVNRSGYEEGLAFGGGSFAIGAMGETLAEAPLLEPALVVATIDPDRTRAARAAYPLVRDERPGLLARELRRIARGEGIETDEEDGR